MSRASTETVVEDAALSWLDELGYAVRYGPAIALGEPSVERADENYYDVVQESCLRDALARLNPQVPPEAAEDALRKLTRVDASSPIERNRSVHRMLVKGSAVEYRRRGGSIAGDQTRVIDFGNPASNNWRSTSSRLRKAGTRDVRGGRRHGDEGEA